jgi:beta-lactamase class C
MKNIIFAFCLLITTVFQPVLAMMKSDTQSINEVMQKFMQQYHIPGVAVALINHGKSSIYVFGYANKDTKTPVSNDTIFEVGSITKLLTTLLLAEEIQSHQVKLTDPLTQYLPDLGKNSALNKITFENLATYSSGLPFNAPGSIKTFEQLQNYLLQWQPTKKIGLVWQYSNMGIGLLGYALQSKAHETINQLYRKRILIPLHMTPIGIEIPSSLEHNLAQGYTNNDKPDVHLPLGLFPAAGSMKATIQDMSFFLKAAVGLPGTPEDIHQAMKLSQTPRLQMGDVQQALAWQVNQLNNKKKLLDAPDNMNLDSLPVQWLSNKNIKFNPNSLIDKTGATYGFRSYVAVIPSQQSGIVILTNRYVSNGAIVNIYRSPLNMRN